MKYPNETDFNAANKFGKGNANAAFAQYFIGNSFLNPLTEPQKANLFLQMLLLNPVAATIGTFTTQTRAAGRF